MIYLIQNIMLVLERAKWMNDCVRAQFSRIFMVNRFENRFLNFHERRGIIRCDVRNFDGCVRYRIFENMFWKNSRFFWIISVFGFMARPLMSQANKSKYAINIRKNQVEYLFQKIDKSCFDFWENVRCDVRVFVFGGWWNYILIFIVGVIV